MGAKLHNESLHTLYLSPKYEWGGEMKVGKMDRVCNTQGRWKMWKFFFQECEHERQLGRAR